MRGFFTWPVDISPSNRLKGTLLETRKNHSIFELRNDVPLSVWRKIIVTQGSDFDGQKVEFAVAPGSDQDVYTLYGENLESKGFNLGEKRGFQS